MVETGHGGKVTILILVLIYLSTAIGLTPGGSITEPTVRTDRTTANNKPDIVCDDKEGTCMSIDVAITGDGNVIEKEAEKILKYKDLTIEVQRTWNV